ncbi:MAG: radical SAM protein [Candidatus Lokiarchaeota archaeon]|nr:radical SAM protein [Candidatus Lokiarchaeota archaeon]
MQTQNHHPKIIQIEVTTRCNYDCVMCLRQEWTQPDQDFPLSEFEKLAQASFPHVEKIILFGQGEPLMHPDFLALLKIARKYLPQKAKIDFTTNGSLLNKEIIEQISNFQINQITVSLDSMYLIKLQKYRKGATKEIFANLDYLSNARLSGKIKELAIETVLMVSNVFDLPDLVNICYSNYPGIDSIYVSHLLPYNADLTKEICYHTVSQENKPLRDMIITRWQDLLFKVFHNSVGWRKKVYSGDQWVKNIREIIDSARKSDIDLDSTLIINELNNNRFIRQVQATFETIRDFNFHNRKPQVELPPLYPQKDRRKCPYIDKSATIIRVDGQVAPCFNFLHSHSVYINSQKRTEDAISYGNVFEQPLSTIWNNELYQNLRKRLETMPLNIPWSGDCPYISFECFYMRNNASDCYGNSPGCNICLYSTDQVKCIF